MRYRKNCLRSHGLLRYGVFFFKAQNTKYLSLKYITHLLKYELKSKINKYKQFFIKFSCADKEKKIVTK